jgi:hypothetical protein
METRVNVDLSLGCPLPALIGHDHYEPGNDYDNRCNLKSGFHLATSTTGDGNSS